MKNLLVALFLFMSFNLSAQKQFKKSVGYQGEAVNVKFDLASTIDVKTWDKNSIMVKATVITEDPEDSEAFDLVITKKSSRIEISSNTRDIFEVDADDRLMVNENHDFEFNYIIYVPKGVEMELSSITGNFNSDYLEGDIDVELVTGNIDIKKFEGDLDLKTITGKINLPAKNTSFKAETVMGEIYANANPKLVKEERLVGQEMKLDLKDSRNQLKLNTVTGDIYLQ